MENANDIPNSPIEAFNRSFLVDGNGRVEITSVDVSSTGLLLVTGCSNGAVVLFNMADSSSQNQGMLIGQIVCKGLHSSLAMRVKISDDSRFCFAGVSRGSNELLAIDMGHLKWKWPDCFVATSKGPGRKPLQQSSSYTDEINLFETFVTADAKLKGFASCCTVKNDTSASTCRYLLACGLGIKNVHVWELTVHAEKQDFNGALRKDHWRCLYDVPTNGNTITHMGFRHGGQELITKSGSVNLRVWDLGNATPHTRPSYEDIANTQDIKCLLEHSDFAYGGVYEFTMVTVDRNTPKEANRNVLELPENTNIGNSNDEGTRRRRMNREVTQVIATPDGDHVLVLVADGGVMHYYHPGADSSTSQSTAGDGDENNNLLGNLTEFTSPARDGDIEQAWALRRVGRQGHVLVLRAFFRPDPTSRSSNNNKTASTVNGLDSNALPTVKGSTIISTFLLSNFAKHLPMLTKDNILSWHPDGKYYRSNAVIDPELIRALSLPSSPRPTAADEMENQHDSGKENQQLSPVGVAAGGVFNSAELVRNKKRKSENETEPSTSLAAMTLPAPPKQARTVSSTSASSTNRAAKINFQQLLEQAADKPVVVIAPRKVPVRVVQYEDYEEEEGSNGHSSWPPLKIPPMPAAKPFKPSTEVIPIKLDDVVMRDLKDTVRTLFAQWEQSLHSTNYSDAVVNDHRNETVTSFGSFAFQYFGRILNEQERLKNQFISEIKRFMEVNIDSLFDKFRQNQMDNNATLFTKIIRQYQMAVIEELQRQQLDFRGALMRDLIVTSTYATHQQDYGHQYKVLFRYADMFQRTEVLGQQIVAVMRK